MILWLVLAGLMALALGFLVRPLTRRATGKARAAAYDLEVYRDQLAEIERDQARGTIDETEAEAARLEVQRRMLAADARSETAASSEPVSARIVLVIALLVPLAAGSLYVALGRPDLVGVAVPKQTARRGPTPADIDAARKMTPAQRLAMIRGMVEGLAARLKESPDNLKGWLRLGRAYEVLGERAKAEQAFARAAALAPKDVAVQSRYALAMLRAHPKGKPLTPAIRRKLMSLLALDPKHPLGLYYAGVFAAEAGRIQEAIGHWETLISVLPKNSSLRARLEAQVAVLKARNAPPVPVPNPAAPTPPAPKAAEPNKAPAPTTPAPATPKSALVYCIHRRIPAVPATTRHAN